MRSEFLNFLDHKNCKGEFWGNIPTSFTIGVNLTMNRLCHRNHPSAYVDVAFDASKTYEGLEFWSQISKEWKQFVITYRKQVVMKVAHKLRKELNISFSEALKKSWKEFQF